METRVVLSAAVLAVLLCAGRLAAQGEEDVQVRLVDGLTPYEGRLEVLYNNTWGTVCESDWNYRYAEVACRMLGLANGTARSFGPGSSDQPIHLSYLFCSGSEDNIAQCFHRGWGLHNCDHGGDLGVICLQEGEEDVQVRLVGGQTDYEGRVEVLYNGTWGTVCGYSWNAGTSTVVCQMLGLLAGRTGWYNLFEQRSPTQPIHMSYVTCTGSEDNIGRCRHRGWGVHDCGPGGELEVICLQPGEEDVQLTLVGGLTENEGRVEVLYNDTWGTVCGYYWSDNEDSVVCGMLNRSVVSLSSYSFGEGSQSQPIHMRYVTCTGSEDNIGRCSYRNWGFDGCGHGYDFGVICAEQGEEDVQVRLVGGQTENEGRVEVLYNGTWGTVCGYNWDDNDTSVVCRMLNKSLLISTTYEFGPGWPSQPIHMSLVTCNGSEDNIGRCLHRGWGVHDCGHDYDIGVICAEQNQDEVQLRLEGGQTPFEGRVEVFYNDTWGAVCWDHGYDEKTAAVVCRNLGLYNGFVFDATYSAQFGQVQSSQTIHLQTGRCAGSEGNLGQCPHRRWGVHSCGRGASVMCLQPGDTVGNVRLSGGPSAREGRLEVARGVYWGTVCDDQFDSRDAAVVCRSLGFSGTAQAVPGAYYGEGEGQVMLTRLGCTGQESFLYQCPQQSPSVLSCPHSQDVGVICHNDSSSPDTTFTTLPAPTTAPSLDPGCPKTPASLGQTCGNSTTVTHLCTTPYSACVSDGTSSLPVCRCTGGRVGRSGSPSSCVPAPTSMLTAGGNVDSSATILRNAVVGTSVLTLPLSDLTSFLEVTSQRAQLLPDTGVFKAEVRSSQLEVKVNGVLTPGVTTVAVIVSASVGGVPVQSVVSLKVTVRPEAVRSEVVLLADGSPRDSVVFEAGRVVPGLQPDAYNLSDVTQLFTVDSSGRVTTTSSLTVSALASAQAITWDTTVVVSARVQGSDVTLANVHVVVIRPRVVMSVREDAAVGTVVVRAGTLVQQPTNLPSALQFVAGDIRVARALDFESGDREFTFQLTVVVETRTSTTDVIVNVINTNDNRPVLQQASLSALVATGGSPGTLVAGVEASDADGDTLTYRLPPGGFSSNFELTSRGLLRSKVNLTRASFGGLSNFSVNVEVSDGLHPETGTMYIYIVNVTAGFNQLGRSYSALVPENEAPRQIAVVYDTNYTKYEFLNKDPSFSIDSTNGTVRTTRSLDREQKDSYPLDVVAVETNSDGCSLVVLGTLTVTVEDKNDNTPRLAQSSYSASVVEEENNVLVLEMTAQDADAGNNGRLNFTLQGTGSVNFSVTSTGQRSAQIRTRVPLDRETVSSYQLTVVVTDGGSPQLSTSASLSISVTDRNDNQPRIIPPVSNITVAENTEVTFSHIVSYSDPDLGPNGDVVLSVAGDLASRFYVNASNVLLINTSVSNVLDREQRSSYILLLLAADRGNPRLTGTGSVIINVADVNDNSPQFGVAMTARVAEDASCSVPFFNLTATDSDEGSNARVTFRVCPSAATPLQVDSQGGVRCNSSGQLDFETQPRLELCVQAVDQGTPARTTTGTLTVQIEDANDNSPEFSNTTFSVNVSSADARAGRPLVVASASDRDSGLNGKVVYSLNGTNASNFRVEENSGLVVVGGQDLQAGEYRVTVQARDQGSPSRSSTASITVTVFLFTGPTFSFSRQEYSFSVSEDASVGISVGQTTANGAVRYSIVGNVSPFQIHNTGSLTLMSSLDRETTSSYVFVVEAEKNTGEKTLAKVQVTVDDVNDHDPEFPAGFFYKEVSESEVTGHDVISISATDKDAGSNGELKYSLSANDAFSINASSGQVFLSQPLDRETTSQYHIIVTAADQGTPSRQSSANLTIAVADVNDNAPKITLASSVPVPENTALNDKVLTGSFQDPDSDKNSWVTFTILPPCPLEVGSYDKQTGSGSFQLLLNQSLDFETTRSYTCRLLAENDRSSIPLNSSVEFTVQVQDVNDNPPVFVDGSSFAINVSRGAEVGVQLFPGTSVTDRDSGLNAAIKFSLQGARQDYFRVNESSGAIWLERELDFTEETTQLLLVATNPTEGATSVPNNATATLNVTIEDDNYRPYFPSEQQSVNVTEGVTQGRLLTVQASDKVDNVAVICVCNYSILAVSPPGARGMLDLRQQTEGGGWELVLTAVLDRENSSTGASIQVVLTAADSGQPPKTGSTTVTIQVLDVNDNGPVFSRSPLTLYVDQTRTQGWRVEPAVSATDADAGENAVTVYELVSFTFLGFNATPFSVDASTGHLVVIGSLSLPDVTSDLSPVVVVRATDPGNSKVDLKSVSVVLKYVNPNSAPVFSKAVYTAEVKTNAPKDTPVPLSDFIVTDPDNDTVTVMIVAGNERDLFAYNAESRQFYVKYQLDVTPRFNLTLVAQDRPHSGQSKNSTAILIIEQRDPEPLYCEVQSQYDSLTSSRKSFTILFAVFCAITGLLLLGLIFALYKWRMAVNRATTNTEPSPYTSIGPSDNSPRKPYASIGQAIRNPAFSDIGGYEGRADLADVQPYLRLNQGALQNPPPVSPAESRESLNA